MLSLLLLFVQSKSTSRNFVPDFTVAMQILVFPSVMEFLRILVLVSFAVIIVSPKKRCEPPNINFLSKVSNNQCEATLKK